MAITCHGGGHFARAVYSLAVIKPNTASKLTKKSIKSSPNGMPIPVWSIDNASIEPNRLSRFYDDQDPDHSPMPIDDPASQQYMEEVNGIKAWEGWTEKGTRTYLENPKWRKGLSEYTQVSDDGTVELTIDSALRLAYMHSSLHQTNLENLYLSSLDVTAQRFRLDTQFFGGSGTS